MLLHVTLGGSQNVSSQNQALRVFNSVDIVQVQIFFLFLDRFLLWLKLKSNHSIDKETYLLSLTKTRDTAQMHKWDNWKKEEWIFHF